MSKKFQPLDYSRGWDDYWRDHPQGYSPQEQMVNWSGQLNAMIDFFNQYFDVDLTEYATDVMEGWYFDGRLDGIINEVLFNSKADKTTVNALIDTVANNIAINVKDYGAKGDGVTDDTIAIKNAIAYAESLPKATILFPASNGFKVTETIYVNSMCDVKMESPLLFDIDNNTAGLVIGDGIVSPNNNTYIIKVEKIELSDWSNVNCIGVTFVNCNNCNIRIDQTYKFTIGAQCIGSGGGFSYNNVELNRIISNKIGLDLTNETASGIGWCNENLFLGGRFAVISTHNTDKPRYGVRITSKDGTYVNNNNNVFLKPSFELQYHSPHEAVSILLEHASQNSFLKIRNESNSPITARVINSSTENEITAGYGYITIEDASNYPVTLSRDMRTQLGKTAQNIIFNSGPMHKKACYYDGASSINVPDISFFTSIGTPQAPMPNIGLHDNYLELPVSRACGIFVNTSVKKRFVLRRDIEPGYGGRVGLKCFDATGNLLTNSGINHPYVRGRSGLVLSYASNFGGMYRTGADTEGDWYFVVGEDVKYIAVMTSGGTNPLRIRSFSIASVDGDSPACWTGYEEIVSGANIGIAAPTAGTWEVGRRVVRIPEEGQPKAWICTVAGTPGTWVSEGNL